MHRYIYPLIESLTFVICLFCYRKFDLRRYKLFLPYLAVIVLYEIGSLNRLFAIHKSNLWIVNIETTFEYIFYIYFIIAASREKKDKQVFAITGLLLLAFTVVDILFIQGPMRLCSIAIVLQYVFLIVMVCRFFYNTMQRFDKDSTLLKNPDFWVHTGLLFFCLAEFLFFASFNLAYIRPLFFSAISNIISGVAIFILYSCIAISFLCYKPTRTIS